MPDVPPPVMAAAGRDAQRVPLLPWLRPNWEALYRAWQADRLPHALLVTGPAGIGKRCLARALTEALLCRQPTLQDGACGACQDCHLLAVGSHPDRLLIGPDADGKSAEIRVDAIRRLIEVEGLTPHRARQKVVLLDPAHQLNRSAANSLLKTLEEPAPTTLILLVTEEPGRLPATIRSRCQRIALARPAEAEALDWLKDRVGDRDPRRLLHLAHGAPLRALTQLEDGWLARHESLFDSFKRLILCVGDPVTEAGAWIECEPRLSCEWLTGWICDLMRLAVDPNFVDLVNVHKREALLGLVDGLALDESHRYLQRLLGARAEVESSANKQLLFESLLIQLSRLRIESG